LYFYRKIIRPEKVNYLKSLMQEKEILDLQKKL